MRSPLVQLVMKNSRYVVYRIYDEDDTLLYVGRTADLDLRMRGHSFKSLWWVDAVRLEVDPYDDFSDVFNAERRAIVELKPLHNRDRGGPVENPPTKEEVDLDVRLVTTTKAAITLGLAPSTLRNAALAGRLKPELRTVGGHPRWDLDNLRRQLVKIRESEENP